jgi:hypothetical protein
MIYSEQVEQSSKLEFRNLTNNTSSKKRPIDKKNTRITNDVNPSISERYNYEK